MTHEHAETQLLLLGWSKHEGIWTHPLTDGQFDVHAAMEVTQRALEGYDANRDADWKPSAGDIAWQTAMCKKVRPGAIWEVPASASKFQLHPNIEFAMLVEGEPSTPPNDRIIRVFDMMGWIVCIPFTSMESDGPADDS